MTDPDASEPKDAIQFLESSDIPLPDGLTLEKIRDRASEWEIEDGGFSFSMERHPSGLFLSKPRTGTPARWHVRTRYRYDLASGEWDSTEIDREFRFDPYLLIQEEFDTIGSEDVWESKIEHVENAEDPEAVLEQEFAPVEEAYRSSFGEGVPEAKLEKMLTILKQEFRDRAGVE